MAFSVLAPVSASIFQAAPVVRLRSSTTFSSSFKGIALEVHPVSPVKQKHGNAHSIPLQIVCARKKGKKWPKMKTRKSVYKRFKVTGSGVLMRRRAGKQHLNRKKRGGRLRRLKKMVQVHKSDYKAIMRACPYMKINKKAVLRRLRKPKQPVYRLPDRILKAFSADRTESPPATGTEPLVSPGAEPPAAPASSE